MSCWRLRSPQQQHVLVTLLLFSLSVSTALAVKTRQWEDDAGSNWNSNWNSNSNWNTDSGQSWSSVRQPGASDAPAPFIPGPPTGPSLVRDNGGSSVKSGHSQHVKDNGPQPGFSGGFLPRAQRCSNPSLPGCQACVGDVCTACYIDLGDASFVLSTETNQCVCPPGFGRIADEDLPDWWSGRRLLQTPALSSNSSSSVEHAEPEDAHAVSTMGLPTPPPAWATDCLPCPPNFYSPGGAIGFAQCKTCPDGWTTGNASASADCLVPYCAAGQEVNRRTSRCRQCPFGTYRPASSNNATCIACPTGFTTPARGSTSRVDCRVPICSPGQQLDIDLFICRNCTGNSISPGGVRANGPYQPFCQPCPTFTAAVNRTVCFDDACPSPEAFSIVCRTDQVPSCGPGAKPIKLDDLCTAFPLGAKLQWIRANVERDSLNGTAYAASSNFTTPAVAYCPAGANGTNVWYPYITSFNGRVNCFCTADTSCKFTAQGQTSTDSAFAVTNFNPAINITLHDPQLTSLRTILRAMTQSRANYTQFATRLGSYCLPDASLSNGLQTSCLGPYLFNITYAPDTTLPYRKLNGTLPAAVYLPGLSHLQQLTCAGCGLQGQLPDDWGISNNLQALQKLDLGTNLFTGTLPVNWGGFVNLVNLTLSSSGYIGAVPSFWGNMRSLAYANFSSLVVEPNSCMPTEWRTRNGLIPQISLFTNANQPFCG